MASLLRNRFGCRGSGSNRIPKAGQGLQALLASVHVCYFSPVVPLPRLIPLFPLPNVVLFPQVLLPLHIFEPRYREMVKDVAESDDELIGMILLRGHEDLADPGHDVFTIGCAGRMIRKVDLPDGRSNILLQGVRE